MKIEIFCDNYHDRSEAETKEKILVSGNPEPLKTGIDLSFNRNLGSDL